MRWLKLRHGLASVLSVSVLGALLHPRDCPDGDSGAFEMACVFETGDPSEPPDSFRVHR